MKKKIGEIPLLKKLIACFTIVVLLFSSVFMYSCTGVQQQKFTNCINIQQSQQQVAFDTMNSVIDEYINTLTEKGYEIADYKLDTNKLLNIILNQKMIIQKENKDNLKSNIKDSLEINISAIKIVIGNESYYFSNNLESDNFMKELNSFINQEYSQENIIINIKELTSNEIINNKIQEVKEQKQEIDRIEKEKQRQKELEEQQQRKKYTVTSRGGITSRSESSSKKSLNGAPMASYVYISSPYGMRHGKMHTGVDFAASAGTHVYAWKSGTVIQAGWNGSYGNFIAIQHSDGTISRYAHLSGYNCSAGDTVEKGSTIGYVGSTGNSTGPHLHFEIQINGNFVNPLNYL